MKAHDRFVANFIAARHALDVSQAYMAGRLRYRVTGWNTRSVTNFEGGRRAITIAEAEVLASLVCVPLDRMLTESATWCADTARANSRAGAMR